MLTAKAPFTIKVDELAWIAKAISQDRDHPALRHALLAYYEGSAVLVATDTHRLHMLYLGPSEEFAGKLIDIKRVVFEARYVKAKHVQIDIDSDRVMVGKLNKKSGSLNPSSLIHTPVFNTVGDKFPNFQKVIPDTKRPLSDLFAINSRYFIDATELSRKYSAFRTAILQEAPGHPLVFQPLDKHPRWKAIVMPMAIGEWEV